MPLFRAGVSFRDEDGHAAERTWYVNAANVAAAETRVRQMAIVLMPLLAGKMDQEFTLTSVLGFLATFYKNVADAGSEVEITADLSLERIGSGTSTFTFPTFDKNAYTIPGGDIDRTDPDWVAFETELITMGWADYRDGDYLSVLKAEEGFG